MEREIQPCAGGGSEQGGKRLPVASPPHANSLLEVNLQRWPRAFQQRGSVKLETGPILMNMATRDQAYFI